MGGIRERGKVEARGREGGGVKSEEAMKGSSCIEGRRRGGPESGARGPAERRGRFVGVRVCTGVTCAVPFEPVRSGCVCVAAAAFCSPPPAFEDVLFPSRSSLEAAAASTVASLMHAHARSGVSKCAVSSVDSLARPQPRTLCTFTQRRYTMRRDCGSTLAGPRFFTSRTAPEAPAPSLPAMTAPRSRQTPVHNLRRLARFGRVFARCTGLHQRRWLAVSGRVVRPTPCGT